MTPTEHRRDALPDVLSDDTDFRPYEEIESFELRRLRLRVLLADS